MVILEKFQLGVLKMSLITIIVNILKYLFCIVRAEMSCPRHVLNASLNT